MRPGAPPPDLKPGSFMPGPDEGPVLESGVFN